MMKRRTVPTASNGSIAWVIKNGQSSEYDFVKSEILQKEPINVVFFLHMQSWE